MLNEEDRLDRADRASFVLEHEVVVLEGRAERLLDNFVEPVILAFVTECIPPRRTALELLSCQKAGYAAGK